MDLLVGKVSKMFGISRTTLLYYNKIGLLCPASRSASGYRLYSREDISRLNEIMILKNAGVPIKQITSLIASDDTIVFGKLMKRLGELNQEIDKLKTFQQQIITIMDKSLILKSFREKDDKMYETMMDKIISYAEIGLDERVKWHAEFEKQSPQLHEHFLSVLGLTAGEIQDLKDKIHS